MYLDVRARVEAVELVEELEHGALDLTLAAAGGVVPLGADGVDLVDEDNRRRLLVRHAEELAHEPWPVAEVLLDELRARDTQKGRRGLVGDGLGEERLARARRAVQQHALWRVDAQLHEALRVEHRQLEHLAQLLDLVLVAANVVVGDVGLLLHGHHRHGRVDLRRQRDLDLVLVAVDAHAHALLHVRGRDPVAEPDHELCDLLHVDHVLRVVRVRADDLGAARDLRAVGGACARWRSGGER